MEKATSAVIAAVLVIVIVISGVLILTIPQVEPLPDLGQAPDFVLRDQDSSTVSLNTYSGAVLLIDFIYTECFIAEMCPLSSSQMRQVQNNLLELGYAAEDFHLLTISFDWEVDGPSRMMEYGQGYGANFTVWSFLSGTEEQIQNVTDAYGITVIYNYTMTSLSKIQAHTMLLTVVDASGHIRARHLTTMIEGWSVDLVTDQVVQLIHEAHSTS
ncbi:MAG: SCO family protein [Candidatus Thorarchaeota archaeon]